MANQGGASEGYKVGYGRPPKATQFAPGKCPNPRGRPRGSRPVAAILKDALSRKVTITENGKTRRVSALDGMLRRAVSDGLRGDKGAQKFVLSLVERYADSPETTINLDELLAEDRTILAGYAISNGSPSDAAASSPPSSIEGEGGEDDDNL
jgi:Family of unknown function (DUF5681)